MRIVLSVACMMAMLGSGPASGQQHNQTDLELLRQRAAKSKDVSAPGTTQDLRLQQRMDRQSKALAIQSNAVRKSSRTKKSTIKKMQQ